MRIRHAFKPVIMMIHRNAPLLVLLLTSFVLRGQAVFTESGSFVVPPGVTQATFELVGAGGNGAGNGGGGGGGGGYARGTFNVVPGTSISIVVGEGGSGLATIVGGFGILAGAGGNATTVPNPNIGGGGAGGVGMGGQVMRTGGAGGGGYWTYFGGGGGGAAGPLANGSAGGNTIAWNGSNCLTPGGAAGVGGGAPAADGGKGAGFVDAICSVADPAQNGGSYGGGGGGGNGNSSPTATGGGGVCIVTWNMSTGSAAVTPEAVSVPVENPFSDRIRLSKVSGAERYELRDAAGRSIWSGMHIEEQDFSGLEVGAYLLRVKSGSTVRTIRMFKQGGR